MTLWQFKMQKILVLSWWASLLLFTAGARIGSSSKPNISQHNGHRNVQSAQEVGNNGRPSSEFPLGECEGDCDSDDECAGNLKCMQRSGNEKVPGCKAKSEHEGHDFCYNPDRSNTDDEDDENVPRAGTLGRVGNNGQPASVFPLERCHGDCDSDDDCKGSLKCYQRSSNEPEPPSCKGETSGSTDYCYNPDDNDDKDEADGSDGGGGDSFRLEMYWREDFFWQEETKKREWCMQCQGGEGNNCNSGDDIEISKCGGDSTPFVLRNRNGDEAQLQVAGTDMCLEMVGEKQYQFTRGRAIELRDCSSSNDDQYFKADWGDNRFIIRTNHNDGCLSQDHHPKDHEEIFSENCDRAADSNTIYWIKS